MQAHIESPPQEGCGGREGCPGQAGDKEKGILVCKNVRVYQCEYRGTGVHKHMFVYVYSISVWVHRCVSVASYSLQEASARATPRGSRGIVPSTLSHG